MCGGETLRQLRWFGRSFRRLLSCHPICPGQEEFEESANDGDGQCGVIMRDFAGFVHDPVANGRDSVEPRQRPASRNRFHRFKSLAPICFTRGSVPPFMPHSQTWKNEVALGAFACQPFYSKLSCAFHCPGSSCL